PIIIHLDDDINQADEMEYRKISGIIIRSAVNASTRLLDELELFLHKMQKSDKKTESGMNVSVLNDQSLLNKTVLVVDDDMRNVFALSAVLES
ncbi:hypothetical protein OH407_23760, partial [Salmonella enterica]